ncbi:MAG: N-acetyltransferase [Pseudomonadota bacterium]
MCEHTFGIHLAQTEVARQSVNTLLNRMYSWRGYAGRHHVDAHPNRITLAASGEAGVIGTVTLGTDSSSGILADEIFKPEIDVHRQRGARICEVTKLAVDPIGYSKMALASLFHIVYIYAHKIHECTDMFIEINPRHRRYYEKMLGFQREADMRDNPRVNAPAYLMRISLDYMESQIERLGGTSAAPGAERSLYPYFFDRREETGIMHRLLHWRDAAPPQHFAHSRAGAR